MEQLSRGQRQKLSQFQIPFQFKCQVDVKLPAQNATILAIVTDQNQKIVSAKNIVHEQQSHKAVQIINTNGQQLTPNQAEYFIDLSQLQQHEQIVFVVYFAQLAPRLFDELAIVLSNQIQYRFSHLEFNGEQSIILGVLYLKDSEHRFHAYGNGYQQGLDGLTKHFSFDFSKILTSPISVPHPPKNSQHDTNTTKLPISLPKLWSGKQPTPSIPGGLIHGIYYIEIEQNDGLKSSGSGFAISPGGYILTCYHVIENAHKITVMAEQSQLERQAVVVAADEHHDLALLWLNDQQGLTDWLILGLEREPQLGDELGLLAYPLGTAFGRSVTYSQGIINGVRQQSNTSFLQIDTGAAPGSSGGAIFLRNSGQVIGMLHGGLPMAHGMIVNLGIDLRNLKLLNWVH
jgi:S1-C subfamily serine protease